MNHLAISGILIFFSSLFSAIVVCLKSSKKMLGFSWALFSFSVALWGVGLFKSFSSENAYVALSWARFLNLSAIFIPIFFFNFVVLFAEQIQQKKKELIFYYCFIIAYFILALFRPQEFVAGVEAKLSFSYYPTAGWIYVLFLPIFAYFVVYGIIILLKTLTKASSYRKNQIKYLLLGICVGFAGGATTFPLVFGINVYPFGTYFVPFYVLWHLP